MVGGNPYPLTPHQSALRLTASPQGEAFGWCIPQAFPLRGRWPSEARPDEVEADSHVTSV